MAKKRLYDPKSEVPFNISRSKIESFVKCPKCFYMDRRLGIGRPSIPGYTLNSAVDTLLKKEFDGYRVAQTCHPLMSANNIEAVPYKHESMEDWRNNFRGIRHHHVMTNLMIFGAVDDVWAGQDNELYVVDYKATAKKDEVLGLDPKWGISYARQMEIYQWLFLQNNFKVSNTGYFVYANGDKTPDEFNAKLNFRMTVIKHEGNNSWVEPIIIKLKECLDSPVIPGGSEDCEYCKYRDVSYQATK